MFMNAEIEVLERNARAVFLGSNRGIHLAIPELIGYLKTSKTASRGLDDGEVLDALASLGIQRHLDTDMLVMEVKGALVLVLHINSEEQLNKHVIPANLLQPVLCHPDEAVLMNGMGLYAVPVDRFSVLRATKISNYTITEKARTHNDFGRAVEAADYALNRSQVTT